MHTPILDNDDLWVPYKRLAIFQPNCQDVNNFGENNLSIKLAVNNYWKVVCWCWPMTSPLIPNTIAVMMNKVGELTVSSIYHSYIHQWLATDWLAFTLNSHRSAIDTLYDTVNFIHPLHYAIGNNGNIGPCIHFSSCIVLIAVWFRIHFPRISIIIFHWE